ncbi:MAG TPA: FAD-dependent oxidoreductase, partial [Microthrixaceae bacterium]|nr:FAD-dependent oxidoreductase [Microthrixaceae bacterium]
MTPGPAVGRSTDGSTGGAGRHLVVVGGGITGLAAAWEASARAGVTVTVLEASDRLGGKVRTSAIELPGGPRTVDEGADNFLARVPDAVELCVELGLEDQLIEPAIGRAAVWARGAVRPYPTRHVLGVPLDADELARTGIVSDDAVRAVAGEVDSTDPAPPDDVAIGAFIGGRFGREVVEHLVGPLVGGINAGDVDELSLRAVTPQLAAAAADGASLTLALRHRLA